MSWWQGHLPSPGHPPWRSEGFRSRLTDSDAITHCAIFCLCSDLWVRGRRRKQQRQPKPPPEDAEALGWDRAGTRGYSLGLEDQGDGSWRWRPERTGVRSVHARRTLWTELQKDVAVGRGCVPRQEAPETPQPPRDSTQTETREQRVHTRRMRMGKQTENYCSTYFLIILTEWHSVQRRSFVFISTEYSFVFVFFFLLLPLALCHCLYQSYGNKPIKNYSTGNSLFSLHMSRSQGEFLPPLLLCPK